MAVIFFCPIAFIANKPRARALQSCILYCCSKQLDFLTVLHLPGRASRLASNVAKAVAVATAS